MLKPERLPDLNTVIRDNTQHPQGAQDVEIAIVHPGLAPQVLTHSVQK